MPRARPIKPFEEARPDVWLVRDAAAKGGLVMVVRLEQWICSVCGETLCEHVRGPRADVIARLSRRAAAAQVAAAPGAQPKAVSLDASAPASPVVAGSAKTEPQSETAEEAVPVPAPSVASEATDVESEQNYAFETLGIRRKPRPVKVSDRSVQRLGSEAA